MLFKYYFHNPICYELSIEELVQIQKIVADQLYDIDFTFTHFRFRSQSPDLISANQSLREQFCCCAILAGTFTLPTGRSANAIIVMSTLLVQQTVAANVIM